MMIDRFDGEYRWLSNFWPSQVHWELEFPSVEHAYQAAKCSCQADRQRFLGITAGQAKRLGRQVELRPDWEDVKIHMMEYLLRQKFAARSELAAKLLATGDEELVEGNSWGDTYWGVCRGQGQNRLGKLLMQIRQELRV
jgi:ribA/ribD-fused uncharacterized protein